MKKMFYTNLSRLPTTKPQYILLAGEGQPSIPLHLPKTSNRDQEHEEWHTPSPDHISADLLRPQDIRYMTYLLCSFLEKGDCEDLRSRPICLVSLLYKLFTTTIFEHISRTLDVAQPEKQIRFHEGFSCMNHIQTALRITRVCREYRLSLVPTFTDYENSADSAETNAICLHSSIKEWTRPT